MTNESESLAVRKLMEILKAARDAHDILRHSSFDEGTKLVGWLVEQIHGAELEVREDEQNKSK